MKCYWIIGDWFTRETRSGWCCSVDGAAVFKSLWPKQRCSLWHLHGQNFWEIHLSGTALWHPTQLQSCFLHQLHCYMAENQGLPGGCRQVSFFFRLLPFVHIKLHIVNYLNFFFFLSSLNRGCPQCRVKSSFYIPSKHWVCNGDEKASLIAAFKERSRLKMVHIHAIKSFVMV